MPKSIAELRKSPHVGRPERHFPVCVAGKLNAEFDRIDAELEDLLTALPALPDEDGEPTGPPKRMGQKSPAQHPKVQKLNKRREELREEMLEHTVQLLLRAREAGLWRNWVNENPPRDGNAADERAGHDIDALLEELRTSPRDYLVSINGEAYSDEDWAFIWSNAAEGDKWRLAAAVRGLHLSGVDVPKSLTSWLATEQNAKRSS